MDVAKEMVVDRVVETIAGWAFDIYNSDYMPYVISMSIAFLVIFIIICLAIRLVVFEKNAIRKAEGKEGMIGGNLGSVLRPAEYSRVLPPSEGLYPGSPSIMLYVNPNEMGRPLIAALQSDEQAPKQNPVVENVPFDARWVISRAGWAYGPMSGEANQVGMDC